MSLPPKTELEQPLGAPGESRSTADLHIAEYQAVRAGLNQWLALQYATYSVTVVLIGLAVQASRVHVTPDTLIWASTLVLLLMGWAWLMTACEILRHALYIESKLKPKICALFPTEAFWQYEQFLTATRQKTFAKFEWKFGLLIPYLAALGALAWFNYRLVKRPWGVPDYVWAAMAAYFLLMTCFKASQAKELQNKLAAAM